MKQYDEIPGPKVLSDSDIDTRSHHEWYHIDEFDRDEIDETAAIHIYTFESEHRADEVAFVCSQCRRDFIYATSVVFPDDVRELVADASNEYRQALKDALDLCPTLDNCSLEDIEFVANQIYADMQSDTETLM